MTRSRRAHRGVSLIEALVALAVMAFGMLGMVGLQATLRTNSDVAKQRAQAVRIAQAGIEDWRAFETLSATSGVTDFTDITTSINGTTFSGLNSNTVFTRSAVVQPAVLTSDDPQFKTVTMQVVWSDRSGQNLSVALVSSIAGVSPELAGSLGMASDRGPTQQPRRNAGVPPAAVDQGNGTSVFSPPGATGGLTWVFNNVSGVITQVCNPTCITTSLALMSGYVRFFTGSQPVAGSAEFPSSATIPLDISVDLTSPGVSTEACYKQANPQFFSYYCALPTTTARSPSWSGRVVFSGIALATTLAEFSNTSYKVCRYAALEVPPLGNNAGHPLSYVDVVAPLTNQNYLVIKAGDGTSAYSCPVDSTATPFINGTTWPQEPSS